MKLVLAAVAILIISALCGCVGDEYEYRKYKEMVDMCGLTSYDQMKACYDSLERAKPS